MQREYHIQANPDGCWSVHYLSGEFLTHKVSGDVTKETQMPHDTEPLIEKAERAARKWVENDKAVRHQQRVKARETRTFTIRDDV